MSRMAKVIILLSLIIFIFLIPFQTEVSAKGKVSEGSGVADISLEGLTFKEAKNVLEQHINTWKNKGDIVATSEYETINVPRDIFHFNVDATLDNLYEETKRVWSNFFLKKKNVQLPFTVEIKENSLDELNFSEKIDWDKTLEKAMVLAENLVEGTIIIEYLDSATFETFEIENVTLPLPEASTATIIRLAEELNEKVISGNQLFSFIDEIVLPTGLANSEVEMSFVASSLYVLCLHTELEILERHESEKIPNFIEPGLEAIVDRQNGKNLLIYNPGSNIYKLEAEVVDNELIMSIHTSTQGEKYRFSIENKKEIPARTIYRYSGDLTGSQSQVLAEGSPGLQLEIYGQKVSETGNVESTELISREYYAPEPKIVLIPTSFTIEEEDTVEQNDELETNGPNTQSLFETIEETIKSATECADDPECETNNENSGINQFMFACFNDLLSNEEPEFNTSENPMCSFLYLMLFFSLFSEEGLDNFEEEEQLQDDPFQIEEFLQNLEQTEVESEEVE